MAFPLLNQIPGFICAYRFDRAGKPVPLNEFASLAVDDGATTWAWLHLNLTDQRCARFLIDNLTVPQPAALSFCAPATRQRFEDHDGILLGQISDFRREFDSDSSEHCWTHFICLPNLIITGRVKAVQSAERLRREFAAGATCSGPREMLVRTVNNYPDTLDSVLHRLMNELEEIEDQVLSEKHRSERQRLMLVRRETAQMHRHMRALRRTLQLAERNVPQFPQELHTTVQRLTNLDQDFEGLETRARFFHDEIDAKLAAETNRQLYILSALTAAFLPPTLVAGLFGMNLQGMPFAAGGDGFWWAIAICVLSSAAVWLFLWRANA